MDDLAIVGNKTSSAQFDTLCAVVIDDVHHPKNAFQLPVLTEQKPLENELYSRYNYYYMKKCQQQQYGVLKIIEKSI